MMATLLGIRTFGLDYTAEARDFSATRDGGSFVKIVDGDSTHAANVSKRKPRVISGRRRASKLRAMLKSEYGDVKIARLSAIRTSSEFDVDRFDTRPIDAALRFKSVIEDAEDAGGNKEPEPTDKALVSMYDIVELIDDCYRAEIDSIDVDREGMVATVVKGKDYVTVNCEAEGEVVVYFDVGGYVIFEDIEQTKRNGFLRTLLRSLRS